MHFVRSCPNEVTPSSSLDRWFDGFDEVLVTGHIADFDIEENVSTHWLLRL